MQLGPSVEASPIRYEGEDLLDENPNRSERVILWSEFHSLREGDRLEVKSIRLERLTLGCETVLFGEGDAIDAKCIR